MLYKAHVTIGDGTKKNPNVDSQFIDGENRGLTAVKCILKCSW